jgi:DNA-binding CsgD family transcriptional regulator
MVGSSRCSICNKKGHNRSTCPENSHTVKQKEKALALFGGEKTIREIAVELNVSVRFVREWKQEAGVQGKARKPKEPSNLEVKHPGITARLGVDKDTDLARIYGISRQRVYQLRLRRGIESPREKKVTKALITQLGLVPYSELSRKFSLSPRRIKTLCRRIGREHRGRPFVGNVLDLLRGLVGFWTDGELARELNIARQTIRGYRIKRGIPPAVLSVWSKGFKPLDRALITQRFREGASDLEIGRELHTSPDVVGNIRRALGLYRDNRGEKATHEQERSG